MHSKRLHFINSTLEIIDKILEGAEALSDYLKVTIPEGWSEFEEGPFKFVKEKLEEDPASTPWWNWLAILTQDNILIGTCGYKGPPQNGSVEIGYGVIESYRRIGLATEIAAVLTDHAFEFSEVQAVIAHTLPEENASVNVLKKCGYEFVGEETDPEDGLVWKWKVKRS